MIVSEDLVRLRAVVLSRMNDRRSMRATELAHDIAISCRVDPEHVVAAAWDLVEDDDLTYDAQGFFHIVGAP